MKFVDSCDVDVAAGKGGNGAVAFRREKFVPFGGPSGGDGGRGGDIIFVADEGLSTLVDLTYGRTIRAANGEHGHGKDMYGRGGEDTLIRVPVGTQVLDRETRELLFDIDRPDARIVVAKGGKGGRGNIHFATPYDRAPRRSEPGEEGEERKLRLELKVMADVGLLGFPNVGKSTFIRAVSRAQPKVADYPFTTLTPHLGVVRVGDEASLVVADIPGLIPGAAEGAGLGHRFLKHVERTRALLHLVTLDFGENRDPVRDYEALMIELERFDPELAKRPQIVAMTKADLPEVREAYESARTRFAKQKIELRLVSAATGEGVREVCVALYQLINEKIQDWDHPVTPTTENLPTSAEAMGAPNRHTVPAAEEAGTNKKKTRSTKKTAEKKKATASKKASSSKKTPSTKKTGAKKTGAKRTGAKKTGAKRAIAGKRVPKKKVALGKKKAATKSKSRTTEEVGSKKKTRRRA